MSIYNYKLCSHVGILPTTFHNMFYCYFGDTYFSLFVQEFLMPKYLCPGGK